MNDDIGELLVRLTALSAGRHVLIRTGWNPERARMEWRVSIRRGGRERLSTGATLQACLERAVLTATSTP